MEAFWIGIALLAGLLARAVRLPTLVGYLAAGLVLAAFGAQSSDFLTTIGDYGVVFLLFTVGLHLRLKSIIQPEVLGVGSLHLLISTVLFGGVGFALGLSPMAALFLAVGLGFSSTVLTAKSLEARNELDAYHGRVAIGILIVQDVVAVALLAFTGTETPTFWALLLFGLPLLRPVLVRLLTISAQGELLLLFGLLMALGVGWLFGLVGLSSKLGALVAGVLLAGQPEADELYDKLWGLKEVFLVGFFLQVGLAGLPDFNGLMLVLLLLALVLVKAVLFFGLLLVFKLRARTAFLTSVALAAYSEFALIVGAAAASAGLMPASMVVVLALVVAASFALNAPISSAVNNIWQTLEPHLIRFERTVDHPDHTIRSLGHSNFLVVGMGQVGSAAYDHLRAQKERPLGMDVDPYHLEQHLREGRRVIYGDAKDPELWSGLNLAQVEGVMLALPDTRAKLLAIDSLRSHGYEGPISALIRQSNDAPVLVEAGANSVCMPLTQAGRELARASLELRREQAEADEATAANGRTAPVQGATASA